MSERELEPIPGPDLSPRQLRQARQSKINDAKDRSLDVSFEAMASELERRSADGSLAKDLSTMKTGALLGNLTRMAAAIKQAALVVIPNGSIQQRDPTALRAQSAVQLSDHERQERRRIAQATDAEVIPE
jgi:hypothetical protein